MQHGRHVLFEVFIPRSGYVRKKIIPLGYFSHNFSFSVSSNRLHEDVHIRLQVPQYKICKFTEYRKLLVIFPAANEILPNNLMFPNNDHKWWFPRVFLTIQLWPALLLYLYFKSKKSALQFFCSSWSWQSLIFNDWNFCQTISLHCFKLKRSVTYLKMWLYLTACRNVTCGIL